MTFKPNLTQMKRLLLLAGILTAIMVVVAVKTSAAQNQKTMKMKMNAGIVTSKLEATRKFYTEVLQFGVTFENDFYLLLHTPDHSAELSFLLPNHPSQQTLFQKPFQGAGMYLTIEVDRVEDEYQRLKKLGIPIVIDLREESWGDKHFAIVDPNGIGIDIVTYSPQP